jgi:sortase A
MPGIFHPVTIVAALIAAGLALSGAGYGLRGRRRGALLAAGALATLAGGAYGGAIGYAAWREQLSPSTRQMLVLSDGRQVPLVQPSAAPLPAPPTPPAGAPATRPQEQDQRDAGVAPAPAAQPVTLPPLRVRIPRIAVDWPVVLSHNEHMPEFRGVGWFMGSAFPGAPGNIVLFGHLGGPYGTFMRLHELRAGDEFSIVTEAGEHRYRVRDAYETTPEDVAPLTPSDGATATLITCSGPWNQALQTNERRLIVTADYLGAEAGRP